MIVVSLSLTAIALIGLFIGEDVLYADNIQRAKTAHYEECAEGGFESESCAPYLVHVKFEECVEGRSLDAPECAKYRTWVESAIFEECREAKDSQSAACQKYAGMY